MVYSKKWSDFTMAYSHPNLKGPTMLVKYLSIPMRIHWWSIVTIMSIHTSIAMECLFQYCGFADQPDASD